MKTLKFKDHLAQAILRGEKDSTWRLFDDKGLSLGDLLRLVNKDSGDEFARASIVSILEKSLGEVAQADLDGHEPYYANFDEMYKAFRGYYGDRVSPESRLKIIRFQLLDVSDKAHEDR